MIQIRSTLTSRRRGLLAAALIVTLSFAIAWAHGAPGLDHMGEDHDAGATAVVSMCLAVVQAGGLAITVLFGAMVLAGRRRVASRLAGVGASGGATCPSGQYRARAGPALLQIFLR